MDDILKLQIQTAREIKPHKQHLLIDGKFHKVSTVITLGGGIKLVSNCGIDYKGVKRAYRYKGVCTCEKCLSGNVIEEIKV